MFLDDQRKAANDKVNVWITRRSDGKYKAVYCYSTRRITKIITAEQLATARTEEMYQVFHASRETTRRILSR